MSDQQEVKSKKRTFFAKIAVVGPSGSGKSFISKTLNHDTTGYINVEREPVPYKQDKPFKYMGQPKSWSAFLKNLEDYANNPEIKHIFLDSQTMALDLLNKDAVTNFSGWDSAKYYNRQVTDFFDKLKSIEKDVIILSHDELVKIDDGTKQRRMVVHFKEHEGKLERHYSMVLYTGVRVDDGKPEYFLKTFEVDTSAKTPQSMFPDPKTGENLKEVPNDGKFLFETVEKYYTA